MQQQLGLVGFTIHPLAIHLIIQNQYIDGRLSRDDINQMRNLMEKKTFRRKKNCLSKWQKEHILKQQFFQALMSQCQQHFQAEDFDFLIKYVMIKKNPFLDRQQYFNQLELKNKKNAYVDEDDEFELKTINPAIFLGNQSRMFSQKKNPKIQLKKQHSNRQVTTPIIKEVKPIFTRDYHLFRMEKKMRIKKKCLKTEIQEIQSSLSKRKQVIIPKYCFKPKFYKKKPLKLKQYFSEAADCSAKTKQSLYSSKIPSQFMIPIQLNIRCPIRKNLTQRSVRKMI